MVAVVTATGDAAAFITGVWSMREGVTVAMAIGGSSGCSTTFVEIDKVRDAYLLLIRITRSFDSYSLRNHCRCSPDFAPHSRCNRGCMQARKSSGKCLGRHILAGTRNSEDTRYVGNKKLGLPNVGKLSRDRRFPRLTPFPHLPPPWGLGHARRLHSKSPRPSSNCFPG